MTETNGNPMAGAGEHCDHLRGRLRRCRATAKGTGERCRCPAVSGRPTCRAHGGKGGAPKGQRNGQWKHGQRSAEGAEARRERQALLRMAREMLKEL